MDHEAAAAAFREFVAVVQALRTPGTGCPWDLEQTHRSLRPYVFEEAYEVADAIDRGDDRALQEELGDLLLQVVLHAQLAADRGAFDVVAVVRDVSAKMVRRHPHVFAAMPVRDAAEVVRNWAAIKAAERHAKGQTGDPFDRVPASAPALLRAQQLGGIAAQRSGVTQVAAEAAPLMATLTNAAPARAPEVLGDLLFALCQTARQLGIRAEDSLRAANERFVARCRAEPTEEPS